MPSLLFKTFMLEYLEIYARLTGRILGILYWTVYVTYFIWECVVAVDYYVRYLLGQDISTTEQMQVIKTILCCLLSIAVAIPLASEKIVLMCSVFLTEKNLLEQPACPSCQEMKCQRENLNRAVCTRTTWLKTM